jgi:hypothetical protein
MRRLRLPLAIIGLLVLGGCSDSGTQSLGPVPTAPSTTTSTTVEVTTTTAAPAPSTTVTTGRPAAATTTTVGPRLVDGIPQVTATPARAPIGATVRVEGTGFTDPMWRAAAPTLWLAERTGCNLFAPATHSITVSSAGRLTGEFTVPAAGACRMSDRGEQPVMAGSYRIVFACTACSIGELEVTTSASACQNVGFTPNSDDLASDIVAVGLTCAEAEALVRKAGVQARAIGEPTRFDIDGFTCVRVAFSDRFLPSSDWSCTSGSRQVTFHRT